MRRALATIAAAFVAAAKQAEASSSCDGVWVVVDPGTLGGSPRTACAPGDPSSGLAALSGAGFSWEFARDFPGLVCRIDGKPGPDQDECIKAPPGDAHWAYWYADAGGSWTYSRSGAAQRDPKPGQVDGWVFGSGSEPRVPPPEPPPEPDPGTGSGGDGSASGSGGSSGGSGGSGSGGSSSSGGASGSGNSSGSEGSSSSTGSSPSASSRDSGDAATGQASASGQTDAEYGLAVEPEVDGDTEGGGSAAPEAQLPAEDTDDTHIRSARPEVIDETPADAAPDEQGPRDDPRPDEVAIDAPASGGRSAGGIVAAGGLLAGIAGLGALQRRRREGV